MLQNMLFVTTSADDRIVRNAGPFERRYGYCNRIVTGKSVENAEKC
jgi:hypothetical protein